MKRLIIIRHAKSSWDNPDLNDFDRPLNERGIKDAPRMGKRLKEKEFTPDLLLTSPANRAFATCEKIAHVLGYPRENIQTDRALYHADEETILRVIHKLSDKHDLVIIFGHNPGLTDFVNQLTNEHIRNVATCGVVSCLLKVDSWKDIQWGIGKLEFYDFPKNNGAN